MSNKNLDILQEKIDGDRYSAANKLAYDMMVEMNMNSYEISQADEGLTDWLYNGDYDGNETIDSLITEWKSL